ncbi:hypothetical protein QCA50_012359 [Cerrena zonata]|uniref:Ribonuclease H1 N-terminal domain-containing protein n=1 Tax=Cerrena zonata TaxID=2478898 RepID=A0AAW0FW58_9APHY
MVYHPLGCCLHALPSCITIPHTTTMDSANAPDRPPSPQTTTLPGTFPESPGRSDTDVLSDFLASLSLTRADNEEAGHQDDTPPQRETDAESASNLAVFPFYAPGDVIHSPSSYYARRALKRPPQFYAVTVGRHVGVFQTWEEARDETNGISRAVHRSYASLETAQAAYDRTLARGAVRVSTERAVQNARYNILIPPYARNISPANSRCRCIVVFRGRFIGIFYDWLDCADFVLGVPGAVYTGYPSEEDAFNALETAWAEGYPRKISP